MGALRTFAAAAALFAASPAAAQSVGEWRAYVAEASQRFGVPVAWIERVMRAESAGRTTLGGRPITSLKGAMGLMQLMPATWAAMRAAYGLGANPYDPHDNIIAGTAYLRAMYERFGYPGLFAAYNAGPGRYGDYLAGKATLPNETRAYIATVPGTDRAAVFVSFPKPRTSLFVVERTVRPKPETAASAPAEPRLFVISRPR